MEQPKLCALYSLLWNKPFEAPSDNVSETDNIYYAALQSIRLGSRKDFHRQYSKISQRKISKDSSAPFLHDDFLIFSLLLGIIKFDSDDEWLLKVVHARASNAITTTFENILSGNFQSKSNIQSLILVFHSFLSREMISNDLLNEAYESLTDTKQSYNSDFIKLTHYKAFDLIIEYKVSRDTDEVSKLFEFEKRFKKRINIFAYIFHNFFLLVLLILAYKLIQVLPDEVKADINDFNVIIGIGGVGLLGNIIPKWKAKLQELILKAFGYQIK